MGNVIDRRPGGGGALASNTTYRDQGDGSWAIDVAALAYIWDPVGLGWMRLTGDASSGALNVNPKNTLTLLSAAFAISSPTTVVAAVPAKRIKVYAIILDASAALSCNWTDGGVTNFEGPMALAANGGYVRTVDPPNFLYGTTAGNSLDLAVSGGGTASGSVSYWATDST